MTGSVETSLYAVPSPSDVVSCCSVRRLPSGEFNASHASVNSVSQSDCLLHCFLKTDRPYTSTGGSKGHVSTIYLPADRKTGQGRGDEGGAETVL